MKQIAFVSSLAAFLLVGGMARGQNITAAALIAERQEMEEKYKALSATVEALQASNAALQKKLADVAAELGRVQEQVGRQPANMATAEDIKRLAEKIVEVDKNRIADNKLVLEKLAELAKALAKAPPAAAPPPRKSSGGSERGYEHIVASGDTLIAIVKAYRDQGIKVSQKAVEDANPNVDWTRLQIGQKLWIPEPAN